VEFQNLPFRCFTTRSSGRVDVLRNDILISEAFDPRSGDPEPQQKQFIGLWDTGATGTVIQRHVADSLGIAPIGRVICRGVGKDGTPNEFETNSYLVNVHLPNKVVIVGVRVMEGTIAGADVLLGMDIIGSGDFVVSNFNGKTTWSFRTPPGEEVDFVKDLREYNHKYRHKIQAMKDTVRRPSSAASVPPVKRDADKVGRNDPCPCGSGKKYKRCHGK